MRAWMPWVVAGVVLLPQTSVHAQQAPFEDGDGERVASAERGRDGNVAGRGGSAGVPRVTNITSNATHPTNDEFTVTVQFSEHVNDFSLTDVTVERGSITSSSVTEVSASMYRFGVDPESNYEGTLTVRIRTDAVRSVSTNEPNAASSENFEVDTIEPRFDEATVDGDELVLEYDEDLDEDSEPRTGSFRVTVNSNDDFPRRVRISGDEVTLTLEDPVEPGDNVRITYEPPRSNPIRDIAGNDAATFTSQSVRNNTRTSSLRPSAPRNLTATADGRNRH